MTVNADSNASTPQGSPRGGTAGTAANISQSQSSNQQQPQQTPGGQGNNQQGQPGTAARGNPPAAAPGPHPQVQLPPPTAQLAMELHNKIPLDEQRRYATQLYTFLTQVNADLSILNNPANKQTTCMVNIPDTGTVRIVHSLGFGTNPIGEVSPIANHVLTLTGDGSTATPPQVLTLPKDIADLIEIRIPSENEFNTKILTTSRYPLFRNADVPETVITPKIMPIITFLVYDGFDQDLDAVVVYKRVQNLHNQQDPYVQGVLKYLRGCMTKRNKGSRDPSTYVPENYFMANPHTRAKEWGLHKFHERFPALAPSTGTNTSAQAPPQANLQLIQSIIQALNPQSAGASAPPTQPGPTAPNYEDLLGMCQEEIDLHLHICGLQKGDEQSLPQYLTRLAGKNVSDSIKDQIITTQIRTNEYYEGHKVPITAATLKTIKKRKYIAEDPDLTLHSAKKGLTLISVGLMNDDEIQSMNELHEYFAGATFTSPDDMKKLALIPTKLPETTELFLEQVKVFANVLYALFSTTCPLFIQLKEIIRALMEYKPSARLLISSKQRASMAWIITLQTKHFFRGETDLLASFTVMKHNIRAKNPLIYHAETPSALYNESSKDTKLSGDKRKAIVTTEETEKGDESKKKPKVHMHELLVKNFKNGIWKYNPRLRLREICNYCNVAVSSLNKDPKACLLAMFGRCNYGTRCYKTHRTATDAEAQHMSNLLEKAIKNPELITHQQPGETTSK